MALTSDELQSIVSSVLAAIQTNSRTIEQLTAVSTLGDTDFFEISGGKKVSYSVLSGLVTSLSTPELDSLRTLVNNCELQSASIATTDSSATLTISSKGKSITASIPVVSSSTAGIMTAADKGAILDHEERLTFAESRLVDIKAAIDNVLGENASDAIDNFNEILAFLEGCKDDETLLAKLTEIKALIDEEASTRLDQITALNEELEAEMQNCRDADDRLQEQIAAHGREFHYLPDNFASEEDLFRAASKYTIGSQPIKPGALLLGCVDECRAVYQYVYFNDEAEVASHSEENPHAAQATSQTIAPPAVRYDADVANPDNWVRLATIEDIADLKEFAPTVELTADEMAAMLAHDDSAVATLALDADTAPAAKAPAAPVASPALERFRARFREMLAHTRRHTAALSKSTESTEPSNTDNDNER